MTDPEPRLTIRMLTPDDRTSLAALPERVSFTSSYARFHATLSTLSATTLDALLDLEVGRREAVIAEDEKGIIGVARYARNASEPETAEIAVLVIDEYQHLGIGRALMARLTQVAVEAGIREFYADVQPDNQAALKLIASLSGTTGRRSIDSTVMITIALTAPP